MKQIIFSISLCLMSLAVSAQDEKEAPEDFKSLLSFEAKMIELGSVKKGESRKGAFEFTNVSQEDVEIEFISVCECTEVDYPALPIKPGESGKIDFTFDSSEKEKSEKIVLDILLTNVEPSTGYQIVEQVHYSFDLIQE